MKILTFYSYKGGVGRTLALVNVANRLAELGKKVCVMDFDLEAPGLDSKYQGVLKQKIGQGLVDYIHSYSCHGIVPERIKDYAVEVATINSSNNIWFIPAGDTAGGEYWRKLSCINWWNLFYDENSCGIDFFLHLKQQIEDELHPDYLLIDSRTGITEMSSVTMSILADEVVVLAANNEENIKGCARVLEALTKPENNLLGKEKGIHFVLTRIPIETKPDEITQNQIMIEHKVNIIREAVKKNGKELSSVNVIHSDRALEKNELCNAFYSYKASKASSATEYLELYASLTKDDFTEEERENFNKLKNYQLALDKASWYLNEYREEFYSYVMGIIKEYPRWSSEPYELLCRYFGARFDYEKVLQYAAEGLKCSFKDEDYLHYYLAISYLYFNKIDDAKMYIDKIKGDKKIFLKVRLEINHYFYHDRNRDIETASNLLDDYPSDENFYNIRACFYRYYKEYESALKDVYRALEINTEYAEAYSTLAEIKYSQGDMDEFYRNLELALKYKFDIRQVRGCGDIGQIYENCMDNPRFVNLMKKYNQDIFLLR